MFGLEKKGKSLFEFDLEKDMRADPAKNKALLKIIEGKIHEIKGELRQGAHVEHFDELSEKEVVKSLRETLYIILSYDINNEIKV